MPATPAIGAFTVLVPSSSHYQETASTINAACAQQQLPPAFKISPASQSQANVSIVAHPAFRFEGFGLALGLRPKISFHVHYQPGSENHVELGKFLAPICLSDFVKQ